MRAVEVSMDIPSRVVGCIESEQPGPTLIVVGALHGNEPAGLDASRQVLVQLESGGGLRCGRFVTLMGNRRAFAEGARYLDCDLNRMFAPESIDAARAADVDELKTETSELVELVDALEQERMHARGAMYLIDLHTVSSQSPPFVAVEDSLAGRAFALQFGLPLLLGVEEELSGLLFDYFTHAFDGIGLVVEAGQHQDASTARVTESIIWRALESTGLVNARPGHADLLKQQAASNARSIFDVRYRHVIADEDFEVEPSVHALDRVSSGDLIGTESGREVRAPEPGLIVMPNRQESKRIGDDGYFIVMPVGRVWLSLSAWIRQRAFVHWFLPRFLPGVRMRPGHDGQLLVSPRVAAICKRPLFHLLGYRLLCHTHERHLGLFARLKLGAIHIGSSLGFMIRGLFRGGESSMLRGESADDWIVARRHLDTVDKPTNGGI